MSEHKGDKTEQPTPRRLDEAIKRGQYPRSLEVQTLFVLGGGTLALALTGREVWRTLAAAMAGVLGRLGEWPITASGLQRQFIDGLLVLAQCLWPVALACLVGGLLAGGIQSRFQTASEALSANWERVNPFLGFQRLFSLRGTVATGISCLKLATVLAIIWTEVKAVASDPIFYTRVDAARISGFMADSSLRIVARVGIALAVVAALDYAYQHWQNHQDLMMTKEEVKEEAKSSEGNPHVKAAQRRMRLRVGHRRMLAEVPRADVVVTNPTHLAVALRYDRKRMKAPQVVAKGSRLNAQRIREIAQQHQVPVTENKPLARLMFKHCRVGHEVPAELYRAVAEVLAWVYRVNAYRYLAEANRT